MSFKMFKKCRPYSAEERCQTVRDDSRQEQRAIGLGDSPYLLAGMHPARLRVMPRCLDPCQPCGRPGLALALARLCSGFGDIWVGNELMALYTLRLSVSASLPFK